MGNSTSRGLNPLKMLTEQKESQGFVVPQSGPIKAAFDTVLEYDKLFGREMAVLLDAKGRRVLEKSGDESQIEFERERSWQRAEAG